MKRRNFLGVFLGTIGALPFVKAETVASLFVEQPKDYYRIVYPSDRLTKIVGLDEETGERVEFSTMKDLYVDAMDRVLLYGDRKRMLTILSVESGNIKWPKKN